MTTNNSQLQHNLQDWEVENLRLTAFPSPNAIVTEPKWWETLTGTPPDKRNIRPKENFFQEEGPYEQGRLILGCLPIRVDWLYLPKEDQRFLQNLPEALEVFRKLMHHWIDMSPDLIRLAFGAILILPTNDRVSGYRTISSYLPDVRMDLQNSSDFSYQINRPRRLPPDIADLKINRLSKWSVAVWRFSSISMPPSPGPSGFFAGQPEFGCRLELDINTDAEHQAELPRAQLRDILNNLVQLGLEIAEKGDIP